MTFSIVARDAATGDLGVAVASKFLAVGSAVPSARAGVGAIATQAYANLRYGPDGLTLLAEGLAADEVVRRLTSADRAAAHRQLGVVDAQGRAATYTGSTCMDWAGGRTAEGVAVQGNILVGPAVVDATLETYLAATGRFTDRLLTALKAGDDEGGDSRGRQAAAILVVRAGAGYLGGDDRFTDLRVDDHPTPIDELLRLRSIHALMWERPLPEELVPIDDVLAAEILPLLDRVGAQPRSSADEALAEELGDVIEPIGAPRPVPAGWDQASADRLAGWMGQANLEMREAAAGWIDPVVLDQLRRAASANQEQ
jgi:uncharacterized Ntn-hydrolase superfamily protein